MRFIQNERNKITRYKQNICDHSRSKPNIKRDHVLFPYHKIKVEPRVFVYLDICMINYQPTPVNYYFATVLIIIFGHTNV